MICSRGKALFANVAFIQKCVFFFFQTQYKELHLVYLTTLLCLNRAILFRTLNIILSNVFVYEFSCWFVDLHGGGCSCGSCGCFELLVVLEMNGVRWADS